MVLLPNLGTVTRAGAGRAIFDHELPVTNIISQGKAQLGSLTVQFTQATPISLKRPAT